MGSTYQLLSQESLWRHEVVHDPAKKKVKVTSWLARVEEAALSWFFFGFPSQKLRPKRNQPWRLALRRKRAAAANQAEAGKLAAKLRDTTLE